MHAPNPKLFSLFLIRCRCDSMSVEKFVSDSISDRVCVWQVLTKMAFIMIELVSGNLHYLYLCTLHDY